MNDPVKTKFNYDHSTDNVILESVQDVAPLLELNKKELNNDSMYGTQSSNGMRWLSLKNGSVSLASIFIIKTIGPRSNSF